MALADVRVNEVVAEVAGDPQLRFVELAIPADTAGNCLFPTTRIEVYDSSGQLLGAVAPFATTVCLEPGSYFLLATQEAAAHFAVERDAKLDVVIPGEAGQVCLASSATRYDCARWGAIDDAVRYLRNTDDASAAPPIPPGVALARVADTGSVSDDFVLLTPTPRRANDGSVVEVPDAGPPALDAAPLPDAARPDARELSRPDAPVLPRLDAPVDPRFLDADPGGGAACQCAAGRRPQVGWLAALALLGLLRSADGLRRRVLRPRDIA